MNHAPMSRAGWRSVASVAFVCAVSSAFAQSLPDRMGGVMAPPSTVATVDEVHALIVNPAGLGFMEGPQGIAAHSGADLFGPNGAADSMWGGVRLLGRLGIAGGVDWIRPPLTLGNLPTFDTRGPAPFPLLGAHALRLNVGMGLRLADEVSIGMAYRHTFGTTRRTYNLGTLDAGITLRPMRYVALGLTVEQATSPFVDDLRVVRSMRMGVAVRPFWERITFSAESRLDERLRLDVNLLSRAELLPGVHVFLNAYWLDAVGGSSQAAQKMYGDRQLTNATEVWSQTRFLGGQSLERIGMGLGIQLDTEHVGAGLAGSWTPGAGFLRPYGGIPDPRTGGFGTLGGLSAYARVSAERYPSMLRMGSRAVLINVEGDLGGPKADNAMEQVLDQLFNREGPAEVIALLDEALRDRRVQVVGLRIRPIKAGWGRIVEVRERVEALRRANKRVVVYMDAAGDEEYHIASAADRVYLSPGGQLALDGFALIMQFFGAALDRVGIHVQAVAAGKYKSAPEQFMRTEPTAENLEVQRAILDGLYDVHTKAIARNRNIPVDKVKAILDRGIMSPQEALDEKLIDGLAYEDELGEVAGKDLGTGKLRFNDRYGRGDDLRRWRWASPNAIAVVPLKGQIRQGKGGGGGPNLPLVGGESAGSDDLVKALEAAAEDDDVKAVVLRVDSPGGDSLASDIMWNAVAKVRKKKPVIASFGDLAASGGYYAACGADLIVAEPTTLTGSIGVFALSVEARDLLDRVGITTYEETRGKMAGSGWHRPYTDEERAIIERYVGITYEQFLGRVKDGRKMTRDKVHELAQGRVWTGAQAKEVGLVDEMGGLVDAIELAKERVGLKGDETVEVRVFTGNEDTVTRWSNALSVTADMLTGQSAKEAKMRAAVALLVGDPQALDTALLARESRSLALMPYTIQVR